MRLYQIKLTAEEIAAILGQLEAASDPDQRPPLDQGVIDRFRALRDRSAPRVTPATAARG